MSHTQKRPHYLYDDFGNPHRGEIARKPLKNPRIRRDGSADYYSHRNAERRQVVLMEYVLRTALHMTNHAALIRHERGRPPKGCETHTESGFIAACVAAVAYLACLTRKPAELPHLTPAPPDVAMTSPADWRPSVFREAAYALLGAETLEALERAASTSNPATPSPLVPGFLSAALSAFIAGHEARALHATESRPMRSYTFRMPNAIVQALAHKYRVRWGSLDAFISRIVYAFYKHTLESESAFKRRPEAASYEAPLTPIAYEQLVHAPDEHR